MRQHAALSRGRTGALLRGGLPPEAQVAPLVQEVCPLQPLRQKQASIESTQTSELRVDEVAGPIRDLD
jgi:hypothetical protein